MPTSILGGIAQESTLQNVLAAVETPGLANGAATQATLAGVLTQLQSVLTALQGTLTVGAVEVSNDAGNPLPVVGAVTVSNLPTTQPVSGTVAANAGLNLNTSALAIETGNLATLAGKDFATQATLAAILAKIIAAPATETTLAAILAKLITAPATEPTLAAILAKLIASPATEATLTTLAGKIPALGGTTASASLPVVLSSDGPFVAATGAITETAPTTDTASSGLNGRLQRIAQRVTSLIGLLPASLGIKTASASLSVAPASDAVFSTAVAGVTYTDRSGTITAGGVAQQLAAANASRRGFFIQNNSSGDLWINSVTTAVLSQPSLKIVSGALYESPANGVPVTAISIVGATTAQAFSAREY